MSGVAPETPFLTEDLPYTRIDPLDLLTISSNPNKDQLFLVADRLEAPGLHIEIDEGDITFAMIRPATGLEVDNLALEEEVLGRVRGRFRIIGQLPVVFDQAHVDDFYQAVKPDLEARRADPGQDEYGETIWLAFSKIMTSGPITGLILLDEEATAQKPAFRAWREMIGPTKALLAPKGTIRGDFGTAANNVVHGSDSIESVHKEVYKLASWLRGVSHPGDFPTQREIA